MDTRILTHPGTPHDRLSLGLPGIDIGPEVDWRPDPRPPSPWDDHIPFAYWLVKALRPRTTVDFGAPGGAVHAAICQAVDRLGLATRCYLIDSRGGEAAAGRHGEPAAPAQGDRAWRSMSTILRLRPEDARQHFMAGEVDLLNLDGPQDYDAVAAAFRSWHGTLSDRGVVLFHGTNLRDRRAGAWRLWREVQADYPHFEFLQGSGLGVLGVGASLPEPVRALFDAAAEPDDAFALRRFFAARGEAVRNRILLRALETTVAAAQESAFHERDSALAERDEARARAEAARAERERLAADCMAARMERDATLADAQHARAQRDAIVRSTSWRITRPLRLAVGLMRGDPGYRGRLRQTLGRGGPVPTALGVALPAQAMPLLDALLPSATTATDAHAYVAARLPAPLPTFPEPDVPRRLTLVTDSIGAGHLFGGVGTAVVLATLLAKQMDVPLRVATRTEAPEPRNFGTVLSAHGIRYDGNVEFLHAGADKAGRGIPMGGDDLLLTTSWWSTMAALRSVRPDRIVYLLQEDERMFYPAGDEQLRCREVLDDTRLRFIINTAALRDHLIQEGLRGVAANSVAFEPAFPDGIYHRERQPRQGPRRFFFYARPNNDRNLFLRGVEAIAAAIEQGVLPARDWDYHFVGKDVPRILLPGGVQPHIAQNLPWASYAALIRSIDVGLSLMYTPHPSYPPLDLAASGAVVVTNRCGPKVSLDSYSRNILCADPTVEGLVAALGDAVALAKDEPRREANYRDARIGRDWDAAFAPVIAEMQRQFAG